MTNRGKKRTEGNKKYRISEESKHFFFAKVNAFSIVFKGFFLVKYMKIADTSFEVELMENLSI